MNVLRHLSRTLAVLVLCQQLVSTPTMAGDDCLNISRNDDLIVLSGTLQGVTATTGDFDPESFYILQLESKICASGDEFLDPESRFSEIQIYSSDENLQAKLENLIGRKIEIRGVGFGAHTRHHYRPLVVDVSTISPV